MLGLISIRYKIAALIAGVGALVASVNALTVPRMAANAEREALEQRAAAAASMLASSVAPALDFDQADTAAESVSVAREDKLVRWVAVFDRNGKRIAANGEGAPKQHKNIDDAHFLHSDDREIAASAPARQGGRTVGAVVVGLMAHGIREREAGTRAAIALYAVCVSAVFVLLALVLSSRMTRTLLSMQRLAERIARGDVSGEHDLPRGGDELGRMADAFIIMLERLRELQENASRVASGDLGVSQAGDGELFAAFRTMVENLRGLVGRIGRSSEAVATAAASMFATTREHEASATQQTASVEEMRRTLERLADSAERVNSDAQQVRDNAERSLASSQQTADQTRLVSAHSERIGEILTLIQDIADKSDLLALNAALEGTRAGEVGQGFSLVAAEMRRLSEHVVDSVRDIRKLVAGMRGASHSSVLSTEDSIKLAKEAAQSASKITQAVGLQREGTGQVKAAADEIVRVVNGSLEGTGQITRSAEALLELSHELKAASGAFRLPGDRNLRGG